MSTVESGGCTLHPSNRSRFPLDTSLFFPSVLCGWICEALGCPELGADSNLYYRPSFERLFYLPLFDDTSKDQRMHILVAGGQTAAEVTTTSKYSGVFQYLSPMDVFIRNAARQARSYTYEHIQWRSSRPYWRTFFTHQFDLLLARWKGIRHRRGRRHSKGLQV